MIDVDALWYGLTDGLNWLLSAGLLLAVWLWGRFSAVASTRAESAIDKLWTKLSGKVRARRTARHLRKMKAAEAERVAAIALERIGRRFIRRFAAGDPGMVGEVVALSPELPRHLVVLEWTNPPGRLRQPDDYDDGQRCSIEWRLLVQSPYLQRHRTARMIVNSHDDADGWVEFEPL